ncbi:MAG: energy-coupling factor transporter transmembrane component T [Acidobacteriota bacterium]
MGSEAPVLRPSAALGFGVRAPFHTLALCAWLVMAILPSLLTSNPIYLGVALLLVGYTQRGVAQRSRVAAAWGSFAHFALFFVLFTLVFNALLGGAGETVLVELPAWRVMGENDAVLFQVGGALTLESLVFGLLRAGAMLLVIYALATFNALADQSQMLRGLPRWLDQATTVVTIAVTFMPQLVAAQRDIREALALRGHRLRRLRDFLPLILILLGEALERAMGLAESMEARGYSGPALERREQRRPRWLIAVGLLLIGVGAVGGDLWGRQEAEAPFSLAAAWPKAAVLLGGLSILGALRLVGGRSRRHRYRRELWRLRDSALTALSITAAVAFLFFYFQDRTPFVYLVFPRLTMPAAEMHLLLPLLAILGPLAFHPAEPSAEGAS